MLVGAYIIMMICCKVHNSRLVSNTSTGFTNTAHSPVQQMAHHTWSTYITSCETHLWKCPWRSA